MTIQSNLIANADKIVEAKQDQDIIMMSTQIPLTNILEEETVAEEEEQTLQFKNYLNSCLINTAMTLDEIKPVTFFKTYSVLLP